MDGLAIGMLVIFFTIIFGLILSRGEIDAVKRTWNKRRCEPGVMFAGFMYKPDDDTRSAAGFATDNFQFCMKEVAQSVINELMLPVLGIFKGVVDTTKSTGGELNSVRNTIGNMFSSFTQIIGVFSDVYKRTMMQAVKTAALLRMAYNRMFGVTIAAFYAGLSSLFAGLNMFQFLVKMIMIILGIILALLIILIFVLFPVMPIIMSVMAALLSVVVVFSATMASEIGDAADGFCFEGGTLIELLDGSRVNIKDVKIGDVLYGNNKVIGTLRFNGADVELYNYNGVKVSGEHLVHHLDKTWVKVADIGLHVSEKTDVLYSLVTSQNTIPVISPINNQRIIFADWEEFDEDSETYEEWHAIVQNTLEIPVHMQRSARGSAHIAADAYVYNNNSKISISHIKLGDVIDDCDAKGDNREAIVIGIYETDEVSESLLSDGVWRREVGTWCQAFSRGSGSANKGKYCKRYHLITNTGTFYVNTGATHLIRDFTEIGIPGLKSVSDNVVTSKNICRKQK